MGRNPGRQWGDSVAAYGEICMAAVKGDHRRVSALASGGSKLSIANAFTLKDTVHRVPAGASQASRASPFVSAAEHFQFSSVLDLRCGCDVTSQALAPWPLAELFATARGFLEFVRVTRISQCSAGWALRLIARGTGDE